MQVKANINAINNISQMQEVAANNIANVSTDGFKASSYVQNGDRVSISPEARAAIQNSAGQTLSTSDPAQDMVNMTTHETALAANIAAIQTQDEMGKALSELKK